MRNNPETKTAAVVCGECVYVVVAGARKTHSPAAGPKTPSGVEEKRPKMIAPNIAVMIPASGAAPDATAIPAERGNETSKSEIDDRKSFLLIGVIVEEGS
jgi:hypothetical protein